MLEEVKGWARSPLTGERPTLFYRGCHVRNRTVRSIVVLALHRIFAVVTGAFACAVLASGCGAEARRPVVAPSQVVEELRRSAGPGMQDCGEAQESREEAQCRVKSVGECIQAALSACRRAYGLRTYFAAEGDAIRVDWLVLGDGKGGCDLVVVEDRSADPLASKKPTVTRCKGFVWKAHESIEACEAPTPDACRADAEGKPAGPPAETPSEE